MQVEPVEHRLAAGVAEAHALEAHLAAGRRDLDGVGGVDHLGVGVEDVEDALGAGPGLLPDGEEPGQHPHRRHQLHQVRREGEERSQGELAVQRQPPAEGQHRHLGQRRDGLEGGGELGLQAHQPGPRRVEPGGHLGQVVELALLLTEALHHPHPGDGLVDHAGHLAGALLGVPRGGEDPAPQPQRHDEQQWQGGHDDQREQRRQDHHHHQGDDEQHHVAEHDRQEGEQPLHQPEVGGGTRDELPGAELVVAGEVEALQPLVDGVAQVELHVEAHPAADPAPQEGTAERQQARHHEGHQPRPHRAVLGGDAVVDDHRGEHRRERREPLAHDRGGQGDDHVAPMGQQVRAEATDPATLGWGRLGRVAHRAEATDATGIRVPLSWPRLALGAKTTKAPSGEPDGALAQSVWIR